MPESSGAFGPLLHHRACVGAFGPSLAQLRGVLFGPWQGGRRSFFPGRACQRYNYFKCVIRQFWASQDLIVDMIFEWVEFLSKFRPKKTEKVCHKNRKTEKYQKKTERYRKFQIWNWLFSVFSFFWVATHPPPPPKTAKIRFLSGSKTVLRRFLSGSSAAGAVRLICH